MHDDVVEEDPIKQGLKLSTGFNFFLYLLMVVEEDPIKQGLKHFVSRLPNGKVCRCRGRSNKTRIETHRNHMDYRLLYGL